MSPSVRLPSSSEYRGARLPSATAAVNGFHHEVQVRVLRLESKCGVKVGRTLGAWNEGDIAGLRDFLGACFVAEYSELGWRWANKCYACRFASFGELALLTEESIPWVKRCCSSVNC